MDMIHVLNGLSLAGLLFLVATGFAITFGVMNVANLAHGALYLVGGWIGVTVTRATGNLFIAILVGGVSMAIIALVIERGLLQFVGDREGPQVLLTIGLAFILADLALVIWGGDPGSPPLPGFLRGGMEIFGVFYPRFRLGVFVIAVLVGALLYWLQYRTTIGAILRAAVDDEEMVAALGIPVRRVFTGAFMLGGAFAGIGGVLGATLLGVYPGADWEILVFSLVVVIVGGVGSLAGVILGSLIAGYSLTLGIVFLPELSFFVLFGPMAIMLAIRPRGLLARREA